MKSLVECRELFPGYPSTQTIKKRITHGIDGVFLEAQFDGKRWWTCKEWIDQFLLEVTNRRLERHKKKFGRDNIDLIIHKLRKENGSARSKQRSHP